MNTEATPSTGSEPEPVGYRPGWGFWLSMLGTYLAVRLLFEAGALLAVGAAALGWYCAQVLRSRGGSPLHWAGLAVAAAVMLGLIAVRASAGFGAFSSVESCASRFAVPASTEQAARAAYVQCQVVVTGRGDVARAKCLLPLLRDAGSPVGVQLAFRDCPSEAPAPRAAAVPPTPAAPIVNPFDEFRGSMPAPAAHDAGWEEAAAAWERANEAFMADPGRASALQRAIETVDAEHEGSLSHERLLQLAAERAFRETGWPAIGPCPAGQIPDPAFGGQCNLPEAVEANRQNAR